MRGKGTSFCPWFKLDRKTWRVLRGINARHFQAGLTLEQLSLISIIFSPHASFSDIIKRTVSTSVKECCLTKWEWKWAWPGIVSHHFIGIWKLICAWLYLFPPVNLSEKKKNTFGKGKWSLGSLSVVIVRFPMWFFTAHMNLYLGHLGWSFFPEKAGVDKA